MRGYVCHCSANILGTLTEPISCFLIAICENLLSKVSFSLHFKTSFNLFFLLQNWTFLCQLNIFFIIFKVSQ